MWILDVSTRFVKIAESCNKNSDSSHVMSWRSYCSLVASLELDVIRWMNRCELWEVPWAKKFVIHNIAFESIISYTVSWVIWSSRGTVKYLGRSRQWDQFGTDQTWLINRSVVELVKTFPYNLHFSWNKPQMTMDVTGSDLLKV